jgi:hypothetical protein
MKTLFSILLGLFVSLYSGAKPMDSSDSLRVKAWSFIFGGEGNLQDLKGLNNYENIASEKTDREFNVLKSFVESFDLRKMKENTALNYTNDVSKTHVKSFSEPGKQYGFYLFKDLHFESSQSEIKPRGYRDKILFKIPEGSYRADWIDPLMGKLIRTDYFSVKKEKYSINTPPYFMDLALKIIRIL